MNLFGRIYTSVYRRVWILSQDLRAATAPLEASDFSMRFLDPVALEAYAAFRPEQRTEAAKRLAQGHRAILVCHGDRIVGAVWAATNRAFIPYLNRDIIVRPREIYTYDAYTHREYRKRGIAKLRNSFLAPQYLSMGYDRTVAIVAFENEIGLRSAEAAGYVRAGSFSCLRLGFAQIDFHGKGVDGNLANFVPPIKIEAG